MKTAISFGDLVGIDHVPGGMELAQGGVDCAGICAEGYRRLAIPGALEAFVAALEGRSVAAWPRVPRGSERVGDLILSPGDAGPMGHTSLIVRQAPLLALSSARKLGGYVVAVRSIKGIEGVYRPPVGGSP